MPHFTLKSQSARSISKQSPTPPGAPQSRMKTLLAFGYLCWNRGRYRIRGVLIPISIVMPTPIFCDYREFSRLKTIDTFLLRFWSLWGWIRC